MHRLSFFSIIFISILLFACSKDENEDTTDSQTGIGGDDAVLTPIVRATVYGSEVFASFHCPDGDSLEDCNIRNESTGLVRVEMTVSEEDQTGWSIELFLEDPENVTFPLEIVEMDGGVDDIPLTFNYYDGSWTGANQYRYQNLPNGDGELNFTILTFNENEISGEFSGEIPKLSNPNESVIFEEGLFFAELDSQ